jgi:hypothetical protein
MSNINSINNNNGVACAAPLTKGASMNAAEGRLNAQRIVEKDRIVVHTGSSDYHARVVVVDRMYVHVVAVHKHIDDFCQDIAPMVQDKDGVWQNSRNVTITQHYGIIKFPEGHSYERSHWSLDEFCKKFNIKHVNDLEWVYLEPGVVCHNTDPRDPWCSYNNERTGSVFTSGLQWSIQNNNMNYMDGHAWFRPEGHHYWKVIRSEHPNFKEAVAKRKESK